MAGRKDIYVAKWFLFMFHSSGQLTINLALLVLACVKAWLLALKDVRFSAPGTLETSWVKVYRESGTKSQCQTPCRPLLKTSYFPAAKRHSCSSYNDQGPLTGYEGAKDGKRKRKGGG